MVAVPACAICMYIPLLLLLLASVKVVPSSAWTLPSSARPVHPYCSHRPALHHGRGGSSSSSSSSSSINPMVRHRQPSCCSTICPSRTALYGGIGIATDYTWREEQYEIDVTVPVPAGTRSGDLIFRATPGSVDLRLRTGVDGGGGEKEEVVVLLDGTRQMRGKVSVDGTYWAISDGGQHGPDDDPNERQVTITIEKMISDPQDQFEVVEFDWGGVYPDDDDEVRERTYDEPEELNVRDYAKSLGVDIDNINMSMVDKTMFGSGLNTTRSALDELNKAGYVNEVTRQEDGTEYTTDEEGSAVPFSPLGDAIGDDEMRDANLVGGGGGGGGGGGMDNIRSQLPFIDTHSQWHKSMPVEEARGADNSPLQSDDERVGAATADVEEELGQAAVNPDPEKEDVTEQEEAATGKEDVADPIDLLTVKKLKEILREQNLKVSGNKQELRDRLRAHVGSMLTDSSGDGD